MKKANSFSKININSKIDDEEEKMFFSMKETLHNPLKIIKSKELLDFFYKDNYSTEKEKKSTNVNSSNKKDKNTFYETNKINKDINFEELEETNNKTEDKNILLNNENNYEIEKDYEDIIYTTTPMIYPDNNNFDKLEEGEKNKEIIDTEPRKEGKEKNKEKKSENKKAWNKIKNIAKDITEKINSFKICETTSKYSIEQSYPKNNINQFYKTITDLNNQILPFEFINYSFSELKKNNKENLKKIKKGQNKTKNQLRKNNNKYPDLMNNYRTYINFRNRSNIKISRNDDDIYTREMALKKKKENKLEEIRKKEIEEELSELTYKPKINKKSEILSKNKMPIYKRLKEIEIEKNIKMEKIKQNIGLKENNINQTNQKFNEKDFNNWLISNDNWNTKKIMKLNNIKNEVIKEQEINDEMKYQFKPKINKNSEKIFKSNYALSSIPISDRLCYGTENKEDYSKRMIKEQNMSFIPEINKDFPISDKYYDFMKRDQFQIYYENMKKNKHQKKE